MKKDKALLAWQYVAAVFVFLLIQCAMTYQINVMTNQVGNIYNREHSADSSMTEFAIINLESWVVGQMVVIAIAFVFFVGATAMLYSRRND